MKGLKLLVAGLVLLGILAGVAMASEMSNCRDNILYLANAASLWANAHYDKYPTAQEFLSKDFSKYVKMAGGNENSFYCPATGMGLKYEIRSDLKYFSIKAPKPEKYGLRNFYFSSLNGMIVSK